MKKSSRHRALPLRAAAFLLCCVMAITCFAGPALAAPPPAESSASSVVEESTEVTSSPALLAEESSTPVKSEPEESEPEEQGPKTYTLTFQLGSFGTQAVVVEEGAYPQVPNVPTLPLASFIGWFNSAGQPAYPGSYPVTEDATYTARWSRYVANILNTRDHFAYMTGYPNGMFKPEASITRGEAAQLFYNLLLNKQWEVKTFTDVSTSKWYATPIGVMATLGVVQGYSDGSFHPNSKITRAEFVKMAVACDTLLTSETSFSDVSPTSWAASYIATAANNGWISGYKDGTFHPSASITRAEAVVILNKMLGRIPEADVKTKEKVKNFYDVFNTNWAYGNIVEASTGHSYYNSGSGEVWTTYEQDESVVEEDRWVSDGSDRYYLDAKTGKFLRGTHTIDGVTYILDSSTGVAFTGFKAEGAWTWYYKNGIRQTDISNLGVVSGPYYIKVFKPSNYLIIFARDSNGNYTVPVRAMRTSCGYGTPCGTFYTPSRYRWLKMIGDTFAQWCTQIQGNYLFHSVPNWTYNNFDLEVEEYNHLGDTRSMGCIRLNCRDAKWIYDNCALGTRVYISAVETSGPLAKPAGLQIPSWHTWDPTDPTAYWRCKQQGCH